MPKPIGKFFQPFFYLELWRRFNNFSTNPLENLVLFPSTSSGNGGFPFDKLRERWYFLRRAQGTVVFPSTGSGNGGIPFDRLRERWYFLRQAQGTVVFPSTGSGNGGFPFDRLRERSFIRISKNFWRLPR
jgi:O-acetyl-ADP-ribose deacetylase (regulator of RNase III)